MTWSYTADPSNVPIDELRLLIGDTDTLDQLLQDEELQYYIDLYGSGIKAAVPAIRAIIAKCARLADEKTGEVEVKWSNKYKAYEALLDSLIAQSARLSPPMPFSGGTSKIDVDNRDNDPDRVEDQFGIGMHDNDVISP